MAGQAYMTNSGSVGQPPTTILSNAYNSSSAAGPGCGLLTLPNKLLGTLWSSADCNVGTPPSAVPEFADQKEVTHHMHPSNRSNDMIGGCNTKQLALGSSDSHSNQSSNGSLQALLSARGSAGTNKPDGEQAVRGGCRPCSSLNKHTGCEEEEPGGSNSNNGGRSGSGSGSPFSSHPCGGGDGKEGGESVAAGAGLLDLSSGATDSDIRGGGYSAGHGGQGHQNHSSDSDMRNEDKRCGVAHQKNHSSDDSLPSDHNRGSTLPCGTIMAPIPPSSSETLNLTTSTSLPAPISLSPTQAVYNSRKRGSFRAQEPSLPLHHHHPLNNRDYLDPLNFSNADKYSGEGDAASSNPFMATAPCAIQSMAVLPAAAAVVDPSTIGNNLMTSLQGSGATNTSYVPLNVPSDLKHIPPHSSTAANLDAVLGQRRDWDLLFSETPTGTSAASAANKQQQVRGAGSHRDGAGSMMRSHQVPGVEGMGQAPEGALSAEDFDLFAGHQQDLLHCMDEDDEHSDNDSGSSQVKGAGASTAGGGGSGTQKGGGGGVSARSSINNKRLRLVWTPELHHRFMTAVHQLGVNNAVPKQLLQLMNVEGMTRENVASHLQKYRLYLKKLAGVTGNDPIPQHILLQAQEQALVQHAAKNQQQVLVQQQALVQQQQQQVAAAAAVQVQQQQQQAVLLHQQQHMQMQAAAMAGPLSYGGLPYGGYNGMQPPGAPPSSMLGSYNPCGPYPGALYPASNPTPTAVPQGNLQYISSGALGAAGGTVSNQPQAGTSSQGGGISTLSGGGHADAAAAAAPLPPSAAPTASSTALQIQQQTLVLQHMMQNNALAVQQQQQMMMMQHQQQQQQQAYNPAAAASTVPSADISACMVHTLSQHHQASASGTAHGMVANPQQQMQQQIMMMQAMIQQQQQQQQALYQQQLQQQAGTQQQHAMFQHMQQQQQQIAAAAAEQPSQQQGQQHQQLTGDLSMFAALGQQQNMQQMQAFMHYQQQQQQQHLMQQTDRQQQQLAMYQSQQQQQQHAFDQVQLQQSSQQVQQQQGFV
ncbi:hypothetical protein CEUSTIGMA_g2632.t1 [Chlamydomonas eustigma]|uniref:HTH myb-type domain-containing protein n=1 Tax=Chlamydomonas eustigma TaxID=1157962 RepID=A0A250WWH5_9CHLO|nr:hypothetical protein CEUSTIGMA_g2632.t1 [Chlamydomonas eustigma]|eukprot:GAX75188.1 hypothetical protein CEUSTIGMA_g2632.t1 [Chlamydomonas eustigma]